MDADTFYRLSTMPDERLCSLIDTGFFNEIITGYVILGREMADALSIPIERVMYRVFDDYSAANALAKLREY